MEKETVEIVIVGGGICGLSLAVALQKKRLTNFLVLERSETLRSEGAAIGILTNGWHALEELGVASKLRLISSFAIHRAVDINLDSGKQKAGPISSGEARCVKRTDLINALAEELPPQAIRFGCEVISVNSEDGNSSSIVQLRNGGSIRAKVVIGCDGANSVIDHFLGLNPKKVFSRCGIRGLTYYPQGHGFSPEFVRIRRRGTMSGRVAFDDKLVYWFIAHTFHAYPKDSSVAKDPEQIKKLALESIEGFPEERVETVRNCDLTSLTLNHLRYRAPWDLVFEKFRRGNVTVAGDAMHVMGPFLGQGGSAAMEDAVVLSRCLSRRSVPSEENESVMVLGKGIQEALDEYVKERRMRLVMLSTQTYLTGMLLETSSSSSLFSLILKMLIIVVLMAMFRNPRAHTRYHCGEL